MTFDEAAQAIIDAFEALIRAGRDGTGTVEERRRRLEAFEDFLGTRTVMAGGEQVLAIAGPLATAHGYDLDISFPGVEDERCTLLTFRKRVAHPWAIDGGVNLAEHVGELELDFEITLTDLTTDDERREDLIQTVSEFLADGNLAEGERCTDTRQRS